MKSLRHYQTTAVTCFLLLLPLVGFAGTRSVEIHKQLSRLNSYFEQMEKNLSSRVRQGEAEYDQYEDQALIFRSQKFRQSFLQPLLGANLLTITQKTDALEEAFSNLNHSYFLTGEDASLVDAMNTIHSLVHGNQTELQNWRLICDRAKSLLDHLELLSPDLQISNKITETLRYAIFGVQEFYLDVASSLFHDNAPGYVRPQDRGAKTLKQIFMGASGSRRPRENYLLMSFYMGRLKEMLESQNLSPELLGKISILFCSYNELNVLLKSKLKLFEGESRLEKMSKNSIQPFLDRIQDEDRYQIDFSNLVVDPSLLKSGFYFRADYVTEVFDVMGAPVSVRYPLSQSSVEETKDESIQDFSQSLEFSGGEFKKAIKEFSRFNHLDQYLRIGLYRRDFKEKERPVAYLDLYFRRKLGHPKLGLTLSPRYFPKEAKHSKSLLSEVMDIGQYDSNQVDDSVHLFWEDLRSIPPVYDELVLLGKDHQVVKKIPIQNEAAKQRYEQVLKSFHIAKDESQECELKYDPDSRVPLRVEMRIQISSPPHQ